MTTRAEVTLTNEVGLHARPAAIFAKAANGFDSTITVTCGDRSADASSLLGILKLEASQGATIVLEAEGPDEQDAVARLVELLESAE